MYSVLIAVTVGLVFGFGGWLISWWGLGWALFFTVPFAAVAWVIVVRRVGKRLQPMMTVIQKQMEAGHVEAALQSLRDTLKFSNWMPMLRGQIMAQIGVITYQTGDRKEAEKLLLQSSRRVAEGQLFLATLQHRAGEKEREAAQGFVFEIGEGDGAE